MSNVSKVVVLPAQKRRQQLLLAVLIVVLVLIFIAWFIGFKSLNPGAIPSPAGGDVPQHPGEEGLQTSIAIPRLDWDFISLFEKYKVFETFSGEFTTTGRKNPFLPY